MGRRHSRRRGQRCIRSRGAGQIVAQYYNFLRLGRAGYREIMHTMSHTCRFLAQAVERTGHFEVLSKPDALPLVCVRLHGDRPYTVFDLSHKLREQGWIVPAYTMAPKAEHIAVLRMVVRESTSRDVAESLAAHLDAAVHYLDTAGAAAAQAPRHKKKTKGVCSIKRRYSNDCWGVLQHRPAAISRSTSDGCRQLSSSRGTVREAR